MEKNHKTKEKLIRITVSLFCFCALFLPLITNAASLYFSPSTGSYNVGDDFSVDILVSSPSQLMNAVEGVVFFPSSKLEITSISKNDSIMCCFPRELYFSNINGNLRFEGIILSNGFKGEKGKLITLNFKVKAKGVAVIGFLEGSVLAHDGEGTNILKSLNMAFYDFKTAKITPPKDEDISSPDLSGQTPMAPDIFSSTHPDLSNWYSNSSPEFYWDFNSDIEGVSLLINDKTDSIPNVNYIPPISEKKIEELDDGIWYFHLRFQNRYGWGETAYKKIMIDTKEPLPFDIVVDNENDSTNPTPIFIFETTDTLSGIDYYELILNEDLYDTVFPSDVEEENYKPLPLIYGKYDLKIRAYDRAKNYTLAQTEFEVLPIKTPIIVKYPTKITPNEILFLEGIALSNVVVKIFLQKNEEEPEIKEVKSDLAGNWSFVSSSLIEGNWKAWVKAKDQRGALSLPSETVEFRVVRVGFSYFLNNIGKIIINNLIFIIATIILILISGILIIIFRNRNKEEESPQISIGK